MNFQPELQPNIVTKAPISLPSDEPIAKSTFIGSFLITPSLRSPVY